ncbi:hypothetical protein AM500_05525 [Bacillus sp. FJAT-18017]|uniref:hypothetical protein n=1 Tax=Bacillus sp. FJAT-18017 TaxID=1705566 RepID=UPI0006AD9264|nr:hypothetical protein [Bacillus sp. FJAT-18017]ALC89305.1 hypothetical protein AM500_05525 [Bacillus sp. FJAT-18017]
MSNNQDKSFSDKIKPIFKTTGIALGGLTGSYAGAASLTGLGFAALGPVGGVVGFAAGIATGGGLGVVLGSKAAYKIIEQL